MAYCPECGIEVTTQRADCPLCGAALQDQPVAAPTPFPTVVQRARHDPYRWVDIRRILFTTLSLLPTLGIVSVLTINLVQDGSVDWARTAVLCIVTGWALLALGLYKFRRPLTLVWSMAGVVAVFCFLLALYNGGKCWWLTLALPIILTTALLFHWVWWCTVIRRLHWALGTAAILTAVMALCLVLEWIISLSFHHSLTPTWSAVVCLVLGPPSVFLLYVRYRLSKKVDFGKLFHR